MDELRRAMLDAGTPPDEWQAELPFLIEAGQKRVRRRRMIATGVAAAVVTAVGTTAVLAGVPGLNKSEPEPVKELPSGIYVEERISPAEVDRRCTIAVNNYDGTKGAWVAGVDNAGRAVSAAKSVKPVENRVGRVIEVARPGTTIDTREEPGPGSPGGGSHPAEIDIAQGTTASCTIPQARVLSTAGRLPEGQLPLSDDRRQIADRCSRYGGYDVRGWALLAAAAIDGVQAIFLSENGYLSRCSIGEDGVFLELTGRRVADDAGQPILPSDDTGRRDPDRYSQLELSCINTADRDTGTIEPVVTCSGDGVLPGMPDDYQIEVTLPDGSRETTKTNRGAYAIRVDVPVGADGDAPTFTFRVLAPDGVVVWRGTTPPDGGGGTSGAESYDPPAAVPPARP